MKKCKKIRESETLVCGISGIVGIKEVAATLCLRR
jgi:hypothetical protein